MVPHKIAVIADHPSLLTVAQNLARRLQVPLVTQNNTVNTFLLAVTTTHLELRENTKNNTRPILINFLTPQLNYRLRYSNNTRQLIARAVGIKNNKKPTVIDATAGLGVDSFILATLGCKVTMLERSPIIHALLADGLQRLHAKYTTFELKLESQPISAHNYLRKKIGHIHYKENPDVIYLDPMYPERKKSALGKKNMRIFHKLVGDDSDVNALLHLALKYTKDRVVVKRPKLAPYIDNLIPDVQFSARGSIRYDVYFPHKKLNNKNTIKEP